MNKKEFRNKMLVLVAQYGDDCDEHDRKFPTDLLGDQDLDAWLEQFNFFCERIDE